MTGRACGHDGRGRAGLGPFGGKKPFASWFFSSASSASRSSIYPLGEGARFQSHGFQVVSVQRRGRAPVGS